MYAPPAGSGSEPQPESNLVHFSFKIYHLVATILMLFPRIDLSNFVQFKQYQGKSGPSVLLFKARRFFTTVNVNKKNYFPRLFPGSILLPPVNGVNAPSVGCLFSSVKKYIVNCICKENAVRFSRWYNATRPGACHYVTTCVIITQCYLPSGIDDISAFTPAEAGTRFSDPGGMPG